MSSNNAQPVNFDQGVVPNIDEGIGNNEGISNNKDLPQKKKLWNPSTKKNNGKYIIYIMNRKVNEMTVNGR